MISFVTQCLDGTKKTLVCFTVLRLIHILGHRTSSNSRNLLLNADRQILVHRSDKHLTLLLARMDTIKGYRLPTYWPHSLTASKSDGGLLRCLMERQTDRIACPDRIAVANTLLSCNKIAQPRSKHVIYHINY